MKKLLAALVAVTLSCSCALIVFAHSGDTDGQGGHYDSSSGDYHYHHGYSAHSHTDKDGDGDLDCPYDFDDKSNASDPSVWATLNEKTNIVPVLIKLIGDGRTFVCVLFASYVLWWCIWKLAIEKRCYLHKRYDLLSRGAIGTYLVLLFYIAIAIAFISAIQTVVYDIINVIRILFF